jgi:hypothetical protein
MLHVGHALAIELIATVKQGNKDANCSRVYCVLGFACQKFNIGRSYRVLQLSPLLVFTCAYKATGQGQTSLVIYYKDFMMRPVESI